MSSTALGAEKAIIFISDAHEKFYYEKLKEVRYQDVYHKALVYCLGISDDTRRNINSIYNFKTGCVKTECLHEGWQTSGSLKVVRMMRRNRWTSADGTQWKNCSAVPMRLIFGRRYRFVIRNM